MKFIVTLQSQTMRSNFMCGINSYLFTLEPAPYLGYLEYRMDLTF